MTWLYGPFHIGSDWSRTIREHGSQTSQTYRQSDSGYPNGSKSIVKKPILKRQHTSVENWADQGTDVTDDLEADRSRLPVLRRTNSDTADFTGSLRSQYRIQSPHRIDEPETPLGAQSPGTVTAAATSNGGSGPIGGPQNLAYVSTSNTDRPGGTRKHVSFNTLIEHWDIAVGQDYAESSVAF